MAKRIYLDSSAIIYLVENAAKKPLVLAALAKYPGYTIITGDQKLVSVWNQKKPFLYPQNTILV